MKKKFVLILLISLSISLGGCYQKEQQQGEKEVTLVVKSIGNTTTEKFNVIKASALQLLKYRHNVELTKNNFIKCIDGICVENEYMWTFYVNDEFILRSADKYYPEEDDILEFRFGK